MAVILYKGVDESIRIEPQYLDQHLQAGWQLVRGAEIPTKEDVPTFEEAPSFEEADTNNSGKLSVDELRQAAKQANIEGWDTKKMKTLKRELGYADES